jgi:hypothetical protein
MPGGKSRPTAKAESRPTTFAIAFPHFFQQAKRRLAGNDEKQTSAKCQEVADLSAQNAQII